MSNPHLPPELLDHIVDLLHYRRNTLRNCCLVSRSWVPRTRKHLFADIKFSTARSLESWKETFPDASTSPARYAKTLLVGCPKAVTAVDAEAGGQWITGFSRVVALDVSGEMTHAGLVPFHGFSPFIKSLRVALTISPDSSQIFDLALSFPLLKNLTVDNYEPVYGPDGPSSVVHPLSSPTFTGSLELFMRGGMEPIVRRALSLPGGIHFRRLTLKWYREEDPTLTMGLVEECSHTLEYLGITCGLICTPTRSVSTPRT